MSKRRSSVFKQLITIVLTAVILTITVTPAFAKAKAPALNKKAISLVIGKSFNFNIKNLPNNATYKWEVVNENVATVDEDGIVTGVKKGKTVLSCKIKVAGKYTRVNAKVTVYKPAIKLSISNRVETIKVGEYYDPKLEVIPAKADDKITWASSNYSIADPEFNGTFKAMKEGTVTLTCTAVSGRKDSITLKVTK